MNNDELESIYRSAKAIYRLADYLYFHNKLRAEQIQSEARHIIDMIKPEMTGQSE